MREIRTAEITSEVARLCFEANCFLATDLTEALQAGLSQEESETGKNVLSLLLENAQIARNQKLPLCQDTGMVVVFLEIGQDVHLVGEPIEDAVNAGVRIAYRESYFRNSVVSDPLHRENTNDNTPAVIHISLVPGEQVQITVAPKGFGSENMSGLKMLKPSEGVAGVRQFILDTVRSAGGNPCPPIIVGVGIGGTMEKAALLAKRALLRSVGSRHEQEHIQQLEEQLLQDINCLGIGPQGYGGTTTALDVFVEVYPTHIAGLPVAVNINCHVARHCKVVI